MDYSPNSIAKRLVTNKSNTIGVFFLARLDIFHEHFRFQFLAGIMEEANKIGYDILLFSTEEDNIAPKSYIKLCKERRVEGAIFTGLDMSDPHIDDIKNSPFPIALIDNYLPGKNLGFITTDNEKGIKRALDYLWQLGHHRIAMVTGGNKALVSRIRFNTYKQFMEEKGCYHQELVYHGNFKMSSGYECGLIIAEQKKLPDAVIVVSDLMAIGVIEAFEEKGVKVPDNISLIGFDNLFASSCTRPKLTTVGQDPVGMGREAIRWVYDKIKGKGLDSQRLLEPELIIRNSCRKKE
jgi:LacI family transcriptional regulator